MELKHLAAVPYQIISPANNGSIVGIFQDSLLGAFRFTRQDIKFTPRDAMNLLMHFKEVNVNELVEKDMITSFDILSQIMPPLTLKYKNKLFGDEEDYATSNNVLDIKNGQIYRGQIDKGIFGNGTQGSSYNELSMTLEICGQPNLLMICKTLSLTICKQCVIV